MTTAEYRKREEMDDRLTATGAHADRDLILHAGRVEEVAVQLAVGERSRLDELR